MQPYVLAPAQGSDHEDEWIRLGIEAHVAGKLPDAQRHYQHALRLNPRHALATQNLAIVFAQSNMINEGLLTIERAQMFDGVHGVIQVNKAFMCLEADRIDDALAAAEKAMAMCPDVPSSPAADHGFVMSRFAMAMTAATAGMPEKSLAAYAEMLTKDPKHAMAGPNACFVQTLTPSTPADLLVQRQKWYAVNKYTGHRRSHPNDRSPDRVLKVGYVSGDFKTHSASMIFSNVLCHHDRMHIEPFYYSTLAVDENADGMTKQFKAQGNWRDISTLTDEQADELIRKDQIDILVDLTGHTNGGRLTLFTRKPAPVQVTAWGFAHGTGCPEIDYFFADPIAVPADERPHYAEKIYDLPSIVTYQPPTDYDLKGISALPYHQHEYITFGSYARYEKLSKECLAVFAEILRRVPDSKLQFKDHAFRRPYSIRRILNAMPDIAPERLLFSISTSHPDHLLAYQQADLILDPFPHGGGVVALETLYMGVPMVTLYGTQPSGRTSSSVLTQMGKTDWIAKTTEEYVEKAVAMAKDIPALGKVRKTLREEFLHCPVVTNYCTQVEAAYRTMWQTWVTA